MEHLDVQIYSLCLDHENGTYDLYHKVQWKDLIAQVYDRNIISCSLNMCIFHKWDILFHLEYDGGILNVI